MPTNPLLAWARDRFILGISHIPFVQRQLGEMRVKPQSRYTQGFLLPAKGSKLVGRLLPQPYVIQDGKRIRLDEVLGTGFALLRLYEKPDEAFIGFEDEVWIQLKLRRVCVLPRQTAEEQSKRLDAFKNEKHGRQETIIDCDDVLTRFLQSRRDVLLLVRPDHYIFAVFHVKRVKNHEQQTILKSSLMASTVREGK